MLAVPALLAGVAGGVPDAGIHVEGVAADDVECLRAAVQQTLEQPPGRGGLALAALKRLEVKHQVAVAVHEHRCNPAVVVLR